MQVAIEQYPQRLTKEETQRTYKGYNTVFGLIDGEFSVLVSKRIDLVGVTYVVRHEKQSFNDFLKRSGYGAKPMVYTSFVDSTYNFKHLSDKSITKERRFKVYMVR